MGKYKDWDPVVRKYGGEIFLWMNQSESLKGVVSGNEGACHAVVLDWINSQASFVKCNAFIADFWSRRAENPGYIPARYAAKNRVFNKTFKLSSKFIERYDKTIKELNDKKESSDLVQAERDFWFRTQYGGLNCDSALWINSFVQIVSYIKNMNGAIYHLLGMRPGPNATEQDGHTVGFGARGDGRCQFIDANLGLLTFGNSQSMAEFFDYLAWYAAPSYNSMFATGPHVLCFFREFLPENIAKESLGKEQERKIPEGVGGAI